MVLTSCIIPTRNRADRLPRALDSVLAQSCIPDEIIVVDDGSVDGTLSMLANRYSEVRVVTTGCRGPGHARHAGVCRTSASYLFFLDSDDQWLPHHVGTILEPLRRGEAVVYGRVLNKIAGTDTSFTVPEREYWGNCYEDLQRWCFLFPSGVAMTREAYHAAGGFGDLPICEDWLFFLELARRFPFAFAGETETVIRHLGSDNLCTTCTASEMEAGLSAVAQRIKDWPSPYDKAHHRFTFLAEYVARNASEWTSVQHFHDRLQREGLL